MIERAVERTLVTVGVIALPIGVVAIVLGFYAAMVEAERLRKAPELIDRIVAVDNDVIK